MEQRTKKRSAHEDFTRFFETPTRDGLRDLLRRHVGELANLDFKEVWPTGSRLARQMLGFANSGGGCLVVGVAQLEDNTFEPKGLGTLTDKSEISNGIKKFVPAAFLSMFDTLDFSYDASEYPKLVGKKFQVLFVEDDPTRSRLSHSRMVMVFARQLSTLDVLRRQKRPIKKNCSAS